ncbi:sulfotransferase [Aquisalimonas lutea]|uniref:tetratricopeptide repeat-containing sulfotransferase family protein n=1 Tax=Aquisalimonas lutea TaxID=1327750 RepID=UPI0025B59DAE|nr:tetratricopeptide repeat-containing sulfotransferase family protein [Aquisalimonas lutea]MDN3518271.1 sulfotransferase [Aquisalimonas lutea]
MATVLNKASQESDRGWKALKKNELDTAERHFRQALAVSIEEAGAIQGMGIIALERGKVPQALQLLEKARSLKPHDGDIERHYAFALLKAQRAREALELMEPLRRRYPRRVDIRVNLAGAYLGIEPVRSEDAEREARKAVELDPTSHRGWMNLGSALRHQDRFDESEAAYDRAEARGAQGYYLALNRGLLARARSSMDDAVGWFRKALDIDPFGVDAITALAHVREFQADDPWLPYFPKAAKGASSWTRKQRIGFFFAWAKALDQAGRHQDAFRCMEEGNRQEREVYSDEAVANHQRFLERVESIITAEWIRDRQTAGIDDPVPIFIVGMPRSGTTLVEQILSAHPAVHGAGELSTLGDLVPRPLPDALAELPSADMAALAQEYVDHVRSLAPEAQRVTDKMPHNFRFVGLIAAAFPRATIIHCRRDPMDVCLSNFQHNFGSPHPYTHDLEELAAYYGAYYRLMEHWRALLGERLIEVEHAQLASRPDVEIPRLLERAGLSFDPACLRPHENRRSVRTASAYQVTQPISTSSVQRWRAYGEALEPLRRKLVAEGVPVPE